jgi:hypothetical protein
VFLLVILLGSIILQKFQSWSYIDAVYFSVVVGTTVGYGDLSPTYAYSRIYVIFYGYICVTLTMLLFGSVASVRHDMALEKKKNEILSRTLDLELIAELDRNGSGIDKTEFVFGVLDQLEYVRF